MAVKHTFSNPKADSADTTITRPSDWNAAHTLEDGSVGTPGLNWTLDTDTGLWRVGTNTAALVAGGAEKLRWDATGVSIDGGSTYLGITMTAEQATTSGTSIDFTGIPAGVRRVTVYIPGVSTNGTSIPLLQIGDSGGIEATNYFGSVSDIGSPANISTGFAWRSTANTAAANFIGAFTLTLQNTANNTWLCTWTLGRSDAAVVHVGAGVKATSAVLDRVRLTTTAGVDTFDGGTASISYER